MTSDVQPGRGDNLVGSFLERRYRVDSLIARGGMSAVYRGLDTRLHRPVALKVMDTRYSGDRSFIERFEREAQAAASLHHPDVVAVYDQGVDHEADGDHVYLVMQLVEGCTLRDLLRAHGRLPLPLALSILEPMLSALSAAHQAGMVHRDIKPENVLIGLDGSVKVTDFGLVRAAASAGTTSGSVILGTIAYLSPEQVTTGAADARTDLYAAGVVLYEMLTGEPPYSGDTALSVAYRHVNNDIPAPGEQVPELPPAIDDLVMRAARRDPAGRPENAAAFLTEVQRVRQHLDIPTVPVSVPADEAKTARPAADASGPPTDELAAIDAAPSQPGGRHGTRAMARSEIEAEKTYEMAAVAGTTGSGTDQRPEQRRRPRRTAAIWTLVVLALAGLVGGAAWWLGAPSYVDVPRVTGEPEPIAQQVVGQAGLVPEIIREHHNAVPEGTVISSSPEQGARVRSGNDVALLVSLGRPKVPAVAEGASVEEAESAIRDAKLQPHRDSGSGQFHSSVPEGRVIGLAPGPGTPVDLSSRVTLVISKGPQPVPVPEVTGTNKDEAFATLRQSGFEPYEAGQRFDSGVEAGHVISTEPSGGTEVPLTGKSRVGVVVSNAVSVPQLNGTRLQEAEQQADALGLRLQVRSFWERPNSLIFGQFPLPGTKVEPGSVLHVTAL